MTLFDGEFTDEYYQRLFRLNKSEWADTLEYFSDELRQMYTIAVDLLKEDKMSESDFSKIKDCYIRELRRVKYLNDD